MELELRPIPVHTEPSAQSHALGLNLAYSLIKKLSRRCGKLKVMVGEGLRELSTLRMIEVMSGKKMLCATVPQSREQLAQLIGRS